MLEKVRQRITFANVVSLLALFVALGGSSYAAVTLKRNSVLSVDIKDGQVQSADIKDRTIQARDMAPGAVPAGAQGPKGDTGAQGPKGDTGAPGSNASVNGVAAGGDLSGTYPNPTIRPPENMHYVGDPGEPAFENGWTNLGAGWAPVSFYKDHEGVVHLRGLVNTTGRTDGFPIFTLPSGYEPCSGPRDGELLFPSQSGTQAARIDVSVDGIVTPHSFAANSHLTLNGITFATANCG